MSGVGSSELIILILIGLIVLGPRRLPQIANQLGSWIGQARRMTRAMRRQLEEELNFDDDFKTKPPKIAPPFAADAPDPADPAYDDNDDEADAHVPNDDDEADAHVPNNDDEADAHVPNDDDSYSPLHDEESAEKDDADKNA